MPKPNIPVPVQPTQGLEDQLLALVVNKERPDLEETKTQLIIQVCALGASKRRQQAVIAQQQ